MRRDSRQNTQAAGVLLLAALACACGGGDPAAPDGGPPPPDAPPDDAFFPACQEFDTPAATIDVLPLVLDGDLAGAGDDMISPDDCRSVDAPFGMASIGADAVIEIKGLVENSQYVVRLDGEDDLGFYVVTGCGSEVGPTSDECLLFVDAQTDAAEVGRFYATGPNAYVVVDYWGADEPPATAFTLEVYDSECETSGQCGGEAPLCQDFRCVGCTSDFDCTDPATPLCDEPTYVCVPGFGACSGDDAAENGDDGPAGARTLAAGTLISANICNDPTLEHDFYRFQVGTPGEHWTLTLGWTSVVDLDLEIFDADGNRIGRSYYEQPEAVELTYLPAGTYYAMVDSYATNSLTTPYTISATRTVGDACSSAADCAAEYRNQIFRGDCVGGACQMIDGQGLRGPGARCDSNSDCVDTTHCASFFFTADADQRMVCGNLCNDDLDCAGLGSNYVCTTYLSDNFCVQRCQVDDHCLTFPLVDAFATPPWYRYDCQVTTGRCVQPQ